MYWIDEEEEFGQNKQHRGGEKVEITRQRSISVCYVAILCVSRKAGMTEDIKRRDEWGLSCAVGMDGEPSG